MNLNTMSVSLEHNSERPFFYFIVANFIEYGKQRFKILKVSMSKNITNKQNTTLKAINSYFLYAQLGKVIKKKGIKFFLKFKIHKDDKNNKRM